MLSESSAQSRLEVEVSTGRLTPLVGRAHEVGLILERWTAAQAGDGQVVLLNGEPGIGKSRLVQEVKERVVQQGAICLEFRCSPYSQNSALYPVITHLQRVLQFERDDTPQAKLAKLQQTLTRYHFPQADTLSLLAALLSLPQPEGAPTADAESAETEAEDPRGVSRVARGRSRAAPGVLCLGGLTLG